MTTELMYRDRNLNEIGRRRPPTGRRPFWVPASSYYILAVAFAAAFFFLVWGILHDSGEELPWITAGIGSSLILCGAVVLREIFLRRARSRLAVQQRLFEAGIRRIPARPGEDPSKLTLERNASILADIRQKSDAANVLNKLSSGHREVFELCREYLGRNEHELKTISPSSPRLSALLKGRSTVSEFHKYHLLKWAEIEARSLTQEAQTRSLASDKIDAAQNALNVIDSALASYPSEASLIQSRELLRELLVSIQVGHWVELGERAAFKGNYQDAVGFYRDALYDLTRDQVDTADRSSAAKKIEAEIERLEGLTEDG